MPDLTLEQLTLAFAVLAGVTLIAFICAIVAALRLRSLRREYAVIRGEAGDKDVITVIAELAKRLQASEGRLDSFTGELAEQAGFTRLALQRFHIVRYDAFEEMGGRLSFSAALLDAHGDGLILTSINGRTETRTYAKPVRSLTSDHNLSDEEREAIAGAAGSTDRDTRTAASR